MNSNFQDDTSRQGQTKCVFAINHRFREEMIVPINAITHNIDWLLCKEKKFVVTADGCKCEVVGCEMNNICELEKKVLSLYSISAWDFLKRWHSIYPTMTSIEFLTIKLKKT